MAITRDNIEEVLIIPSIRDLLTHDCGLLEKKLKEETINHKLAVYLENHLCCIRTRVKFTVDVEYDKYIDVQKTMQVDGKTFVARPDILIHKRFTNENNLLALEAKKRSISLRDEQKLRGFLDYDYHYRFGLMIAYGIPETNYIRYVLLYREQHPPLFSKTVYMYKDGKLKIKNDWNVFVVRNAQNGG